MFHGEPNFKSEQNASNVNKKIILILLLYYCNKYYHMPVIELIKTPARDRQKVPDTG